MRAVLQRVTAARVQVADSTVGCIDEGLVVLLGIADGDTEDDAVWLAGKMVGLRIFNGLQRPMDRSVIEVEGSILLVSQFTLLADTRKGRRPSFAGAAASEEGERLYERVASALRERGVPVETGEFGAHMSVQLTNDGPVTVILDSHDRSRPRRS